MTALTMCAVLFGLWIKVEVTSCSLELLVSWSEAQQNRIFSWKDRNSNKYKFVIWMPEIFPTAMKASFCVCVCVCVCVHVCARVRGVHNCSWHSHWKAELRLLKYESRTKWEKQLYVLIHVKHNIFCFRVGSTPWRRGQSPDPWTDGDLEFRDSHGQLSC